MRDLARVYFSGDIDTCVVPTTPYTFTTTPALSENRAERLLDRLGDALPGAAFDAIDYSGVATGINVSVSETGQSMPLPSQVLSALGGGIGRFVFVPRQRSA